MDTEFYDRRARRQFWLVIELQSLSLAEMDEDRMARKGKAIWVPKGAFAMPVLPESLKIDPLLLGLLHSIAFLELSDDDTVDPDWAVEAMEHVGYYLLRLTPKQVEQTQKQLDRIAAHAKKKKMPKEFIELVQIFLTGCGVWDEDEE